ncbi:T9SS type A sorting domain-containing protein [Hymenobacter sp. 15J16-1T3B]|uniref:T9SS type A sorting domain-containing protein n=1 Tax=Hymenobacter sp. 15J16-1T3B TaxID=2886941 RepID=UPI001D107AD0|nr:T9SS type A sorting domain-containing protein [Hymenobacter sp. 15J16-1T3B]MCC3159937.1 T9SS type A sorting domain-containing protein [Hymenobacter sp. 15J16-1T3B]
MKKLVLPVLLALTAAAGFAPAALAQTCTSTPASAIVTVPASTITTNTTWTNDKIYVLDGFVYVDNGATLTIQPGTIIKGNLATKGSLIIRRGAKIDARGTAAQPIVFTSNQPAGQRAAGDWGGLIICGAAPQNLAGDPTIEGGVVANFGGNNPADNSGFLQYVRIEFPGVAFLPNNEINGLTLGAVGSGTTIDHVQVSYSGDDSFEWFGGTVNAKYLIAFRGTDDDFDTDNGYSGKVQFGVSLRDPAVADFASGGASNGFESDNDVNSSTATPQTSAVFSNMSVFVPSGTLATPYANAMHIRRNSSISIFNSVFAGHPWGLLLDGSTTQANAAAGTLALQNNVLAGFATNRKARVNSGATYNAKQFLGATNDTTLSVAGLLLGANNFSMAWNTNFQPQAGSPLASGAAFTNAKFSGDTFFDRVSFRGAFAPAGATGTGTANWATGWTNFDPQNSCYSAPGAVLSAKDEVPQLNRLGVYPNPTAGAATLAFELLRPAAVTVRVLDVTGRTVAVLTQGQRLSTGQQELALPSTLKNGLYTAQVQTEESSQAVRFVVSK